MKRFFKNEGDRIADYSHGKRVTGTVIKVTGWLLDNSFQARIYREVEGNFEEA